MSAQNLKIALIVCNCGGSLESSLDYVKIQRQFEEKEQIIKIFNFNDFCFEARLNEFVEIVQSGSYDRYVIAACTPQIIEMPIKNILKARNLDVNFEIVNIREQCAWVHRNKEKATQKAIILIKAAIAKLSQAISIPKKEVFFSKHITIVGGGISGLQLATDFCEIGFDVLIIEKNPWIGGHLVQLQNVMPFNLSGKKIILNYLKNLEGKKVEFKLKTEIKWIAGSFGDFSIRIQQVRSYINNNCDQCKKCIEICPVSSPNPINEGLSTIKAIDKIIEPPFCDSIIINREKCLPNCTLCEEICPTNAIALSQETIEETIKTSFLVFATGYELYQPEKRSVYPLEKTANILTQLQLARMLDSEGPTQGKVIQPSTGKVPKRILMIQCVGSREIGKAEYCSKYCCSTAIRQAIEIKQRIQECEICISYIDIRTPFLDEELYREARELGIDFVRGKMGNIYIESESLITELIDTILAKQINYESDIIVLSTAMLPTRIPPQLSEIINLKIKANGFIQEYYEKLKQTDTNRIGIYSCGTAMGPKLVPECISDAHAIAISIMKEYPTENYIKESAISVVNEDLCNGCELCIQICPFRIPRMIEKNEKNIATIDQKQCKGCGTCVSLCPTNAVQLESLQRDQLFAQIRSILADAPDNDDPIILGFVCEECAYATIDFAGMLRKSYSENVRLIRLPCVGRISALDILTAFEFGADLILIFGCEAGKCHYLEGNTKTKLMVEIVKDILEAIGWEPERIKMFGLFSADVHIFLESIEEALNTFQKVGHSNARLKLKRK